jgi:hypothetical protein
MAIACLRLFTLPPLPRLPDRSVPRFLRRMALATVLLAPLLYRRPLDRLPVLVLPAIPFSLAVIFVGLKPSGEWQEAENRHDQDLPSPET